MLKANAMRRAGAVLSLVAMCLSAQPAGAQTALAMADHRGIEDGESRRAAFAGAAYRIEFGARSRPPSTRLQVGLRSIAADSQSGAFSTHHVPVLEVGMNGRENGTLFIAGRSKAEAEKSLGLNGRAMGPVEIVMIAGLLAVGVYAVCCLTLLDTD